MTADWLTPIPEQSPEDQAEKAFVPMGWLLADARRTLEKIGAECRKQTLLVGDVLAKHAAVSNLLWHWVAQRRADNLLLANATDAGASPEIICTNRGMKLAWDMAITELAELLGEDVNEYNQEYELQKRGLVS